MLKALELSGFKSFADRTRLEFPRGISVVVGPNGSGKSNLVDAIKWVLGSQSAKSLRGKEMTDVIFNGCASRGPLGTGEATLTFDNADGRLPIDAKEVHVTRRVYRSGEGEYLINRQACRLRDIRELLSGTGITTEAYCIIEQGKVDALLQSSPRDRRVIFEEAAGISQFKAKKVVAERRLERVEQNLLRLSDIVDEVESRLRGVRSQAGKARRYRECGARLQQLRTEVGLVDWRALTKQISARDEKMAELRRRQLDMAAALEQSEAKAAELESMIEAAVHRLREVETAAFGTREQIAALQATVENQRSRRTDLQHEVARVRNQLAAMNTRSDGVAEQSSDAAARFQAAVAKLESAQAEWRERSQFADVKRQELDVARTALERIRVQHADATRSVKELQNHITALEAQFAASQADHGQLREQLTNSEKQREELKETIAELAPFQLELSAQVASCQATLSSAEQRLAHVRRELSRTDKQHRQAEGRLARTNERIAVLSELEQRLEGLDSGVQDVLKLAREAPDGPFGNVLGVVADLFHVDVDSAPLVEVALGERAQFVVLRDGDQLLEWLQKASLGVTGRIGFLRLDIRMPLTALDHVDLSGEGGVMGRADQFVETAGEYESLVRRLVGRTWLVDRLSTALRLSQTSGRGLEFVTSDGEFLAADGTLIVGQTQGALGMLSRRSELRACREQVAELEKQLEHHASLHDRLEQERARQEALVASSVAAYAELASRLAEQRQQTAILQGQHDHIVRESEQIAAELRGNEEQAATIAVEIQRNQQRLVIVTQSAGEFQTAIQATSRDVATCDRSYSELQTAATEGQIVVAKCEQRVEMLRQQAEQAKRNEEERERARADMRERLASQQAQLAELDAAILVAGQTLADLFLQKEQQVQELTRQTAATETERGTRTVIQEEVRTKRHEIAQFQSQQHKLEVATGRLRHERQTLCERMRDDYGIDLTEAGESIEKEAGSQSELTAPGSLPPTAINRDAVEREIAELRQQLNDLGTVNLTALDELDGLEVRFANLSHQYKDLVEAKASLERIIQRINIDSRQLFLATLEMVRGHFQELFRRMFGGGEADIIVDEADDVLESGIEIVARPPGKEKCSISLLSGGEKTLTCVALLLAVFRSKPSPFCVLDEVDAALDEANIGRFVGVLREFLSFTQFLVVTHSKKTMSGADTIYGVTMEESGVSKRVSVRFEDVSEDGHIRPSSLVASTQSESLKRAA